MKRVSFKVAKAIKDAGYLQDIEFWKYLEDNTYWYYPDGKLEKKGNVPDYIDISKLTFAPYIMEVWIWLWREKKECIDVLSACDSGALVHINNKLNYFNDPEEAINAALEYLVDNKLLK